MKFLNLQDQNGLLIAENFRGCLIMAGLDVTPDTPQVERGFTHSSGTCLLASKANTLILLEHVFA